MAEVLFVNSQEMNALESVVMVLVYIENNKRRIWHGESRIAEKLHSAFRRDSLHSILHNIVHRMFSSIQYIKTRRSKSIASLLVDIVHT